METVLIIEDDPAILLGLKKNLRYHGYDVIVATDGATGLEVAIDKRPDLILLDIMLPGMDGFEVVQRLRAAGDFVPVMILTARGHTDDVLRGFEVGADDYLPKPFDLSILLRTVGVVLTRKGAY